MSEHVEFDLPINLTDEREWGGEAGPTLPPGVYDLEIVAAEQGTSNAQKPVIKVTFSVLNEGPDFGKEFKKSYSLQPQSLGRVKCLLMACGARLDSIRSSEMLNRQIVAEIVHRQGDPQPQPDGTMREGGMFMDVLNERQPEGAEPAKTDNGKATAKPEPAPAPPPAAQTAAGKAVRRAVGPSTAKA